MVRLDGRRVIVALDSQGHRQAAAGIDHSGVLARPDQHVRPFGRQSLQMHPAGLVRAVLAPHHRIHGQFEVVGLPTEEPLDLAGLVVGEPQGSMDIAFHGMSLTVLRVATGCLYRPVK